MRCAVVTCAQALELVQDSKATIFLVLELARGGELFDRIKVSVRLGVFSSSIALGVFVRVDRDVGLEEVELGSRRALHSRALIAPMIYQHSETDRKEVKLSS